MTKTEWLVQCKENGISISHVGSFKNIDVYQHLENWTFYHHVWFGSDKHECFNNFMEATLCIKSTLSQKEWYDFVRKFPSEEELVPVKPLDNATLWFTADDPDYDKLIYMKEVCDFAKENNVSVLDVLNALSGISEVEGSAKND